jgi:hypothetical protein
MSNKSRKTAHTSNKPDPNNESEHPLHSDLDILQVRRVVAGNPNTPGAVLNRLSADTSPSIRRAVAINPKTAPELLKRLACDQIGEVRLAVTENPNAPLDILIALSADHDVDVRYGIAENPHLPENLLFKLTLDENPYVRCRAMKTLSMLAPDVQSRLSILIQEAGMGGHHYQ